MTIEESIHINASVEILFSIYTEVAHWNRWDPDTKEAFLEGPFAVGTSGRLVPTKGHGVPMRMTSLVPNQSFTVESNIPLFAMKFEHELISEGNGTRAVHRVSFSGPLNFILGRIVGKQVREGLPITMRSLKTYAEARAAAAEQGSRCGRNDPGIIPELPPVSSIHTNIRASCNG